MSRDICPRCRCCSILSLAGGLMRCAGDCHTDGTHDPETVEEFNAIIAEKDEQIARLQREVRRLTEQRVTR